MGEFLCKLNLGKAFPIMIKNPVAKKEKIKSNYIKIKILHGKMP